MKTASSLHPFIPLPREKRVQKRTKIRSALLEIKANAKNNIV
jgi:hypothetical protein